MLGSNTVDNTEKFFDDDIVTLNYWQNKLQNLQNEHNIEKNNIKNELWKLYTIPQEEEMRSKYNEKSDLMFDMEPNVENKRGDVIDEIESVGSFKNFIQKKLDFMFSNDADDTTNLTTNSNKESYDNSEKIMEKVTSNDFFYVSGFTNFVILEHPTKYDGKKIILLGEWHTRHELCKKKISINNSEVYKTADEFLFDQLFQHPQKHKIHLFLEMYNRPRLSIKNQFQKIPDAWETEQGFLSKFLYELQKNGYLNGDKDTKKPELHFCDVRNQWTYGEHTEDFIQYLSSLMYSRDIFFRNYFSDLSKAVAYKKTQKSISIYQEWQDILQKWENRFRRFSNVSYIEKQIDNILEWYNINKVIQNVHPDYKLVKTKLQQMINHDFTRHFAKIKSTKLVNDKIKNPVYGKHCLWRITTHNVSSLYRKIMYTTMTKNHTDYYEKSENDDFMNTQNVEKFLKKETMVLHNCIKLLNTTMDVYLLGKLFEKKEYKYSVIYTGAQHIETYKIFLEHHLGFEEKYNGKPITHRDFISHHPYSSQPSACMQIHKNWLQFVFDEE